ncbi:hypothetical protein CYMTET_22823 [Cymbomonas tetramitiformis]|uniref:Uncharacterized protein n=1 Tax=Cymbomonas tetramitiformis TaxID=36881 RepID=A0AAE0FZM8_9CHLO|nr:hypothetical protein CYMTET_22823 [Cymbomonas tetramitiformis]
MLRTVEALFLFIEMDADKVVGLLVKMKTHFWVMEFLLPAVFVDLGEEVCSSMKKLLLHLLHLRDRRVLRSFMSTLSRAAHEDEAHWIQLADKPKDSVGDSLFRRVVDLAVEPAVDQLSRAVAQLSPKLPRKTLLLFTKLLREMDLQISEMEELMHICVELVCARPFFTDGRDPGKWEKGAEIDPTCLAGLELLQTLLQYKKPGAEAGALVLLDSFLGLKFYNVCGMPLSHADSSSPDKYDALRLEASRLEASRLEDSRLKVSRLEVSRLEDSRLEASRLKVSRLEDSRLEALRLEASRLSFMISCCTALFRLLVLEKLSGASTAEPSCGAPPVDSPAQPVLGLLVARNLFGMTMRNFIYFKGVAGREKDNLEAEAACQANCKLAHLVKRVAPNFEEVVEQHSSELLMHDLLEYMDLVTERGKAGVRVPADLSNVEMVLDILSSLYRHAPERARYLTQNRLLARTLDVCEMITERAERAEAGEVTSYGMMGALEDMIVAWAAVPTSAPEAGRAPGETVLEEIGTNRVQCLRLLACLIRLQPFPESLTEPVNSLLASLKLKDAGEGFTHTCPLRLLKPCGFDDAYRDDPGVGLTINIADGALGWQNQSSKDKKEQEEWITYWQLARDICNYQLAALHVRTDHVCFSAADAKSLGFAVGRAAKRGRGPRDLHIRKRAETGSPKAAEGGRVHAHHAAPDLPGDVAEGEIKLEGEGFGWMEMMVLLGFMEVHTHFTSIDCSFILKDAEKEVEQGVVEEVIAMRNKCKGLRTVKLYDEELRLMDLTETVTALVTETSAAEEQVKGRSPEQVAVVRASFRQAEMALMTTAAASNAAFTTFLATNSDKVNGWSFDYIARMAKNAPSLAVLDLSGTGLYSSQVENLSKKLRKSKNKSLRVLKLNGADQLEMAAVEQLGELIKVHPSLRELHLRDREPPSRNDALMRRETNSGHEHMELLANALLERKALTHLDLSYRRCSPESAPKFAKSLAMAVHYSNPARAVSRLHLRGCQLGEKGLKEIAKLLEQKSASKAVTHLDISENQVTGVCPVPLERRSGSSSLEIPAADEAPSPQYPPPTTLKGIIDFAASWKRNNTLKELDLSYNYLGDAGASELADAITPDVWGGCKIKTALTKFSVANCGIGDKGARALWKALKAMYKSEEMTSSAETTRVVDMSGLVCKEKTLKDLEYAMIETATGVLKAVKIIANRVPDDADEVNGSC